jgi:CTP:molybdopterin cytidylyltransferase MocA
VTSPSRVVAVVLAAGGGTRFGGGKLVATLDGKPLVAHVVDLAREVGCGAIVVVTGSGAEAVEAAVGGGSVTAAGTARVATVRNHEWETGLASSVRVGIGAAAAALPGAEAALILLGDQPRVRPETVRALLAAPEDPARPIVAPAYASGAGSNPVIVHRVGWPLVERLVGDRGLGPLILASPELVVRVAVDGDNPDVDTRADLARLEDGHLAPGSRPGGGAEAGWAARVRANGEQSARVRETPEGGDFYGATAGIFVADPRRVGDAVLDALLALTRPEDRWLDIGAGAGRYALPLALHVREVVAIDPSPAMLRALRDGMDAHGIPGVRPMEGRWPLGDPAIAAQARCDAALMAHVGYDIEAIGAFLDAMETASSRLCVAIVSERVPSWPAGRFWPPVHGEERIELPALPEFVELLRDRGREPSVTLVSHAPRTYTSRDDLLRWVRNQLFLAPGSERDCRMEACLDAWLVEREDGVILEHQAPVVQGLVSWAPPQ